MSLEPIEVHEPKYGVEITKMKIETRDEQYEIEVRKWRDVVREDPTLHHWHRRSRMLGGGIAMVVAGGLWLSISTAVTIDGHYEPSATSGLFAYGMPTAILASGGIMTIVALRARRKLLQAQRRLYGTPYASATGGGLAVVGRFCAGVARASSSLRPAIHSPPRSSCSAQIGGRVRPGKTRGCRCLRTSSPRGTSRPRSS